MLDLNFSLHFMTITLAILSVVWLAVVFAFPRDHWGQANVFIIGRTHSISSPTPDQENTAIFPIQLKRVQSMPYRTWPVPKARLFLGLQFF